MAKKQTRRSLSVSAHVFQAVIAHTAATGEPMSRLLDRLLRKELGMPEIGPAATLPIPVQLDAVALAALEHRASALRTDPGTLLQHLLNGAMDAAGWPRQPPWPPRP